MTTTTTMFTWTKRKITKANQAQGIGDEAQSLNEEQYNCSVPAEEVKHRISS